MSAASVTGALESNISTGNTNADCNSIAASNGKLAEANDNARKLVGSGNLEEALRELQIVTVAFAASNRCAIGLPTMLERPMITARAPSSGTS